MPNSDTKCCISCRQPWKRVPRARRSWISSTGKRDSLLLWCEACYSKRTTAINSNLCDQEEEELDTPPLPSKIVSFKALKEELRLLGQQPEWSHFSIVINDLWQGEDEGMRSICAQLSTLIHKHTGYKFTSRNIRNSKRHLTTTFQLQCIQRDTNHMAAQRHRSDLLNISSVIRMERFPCNGWGKAVFHHRPRQVSLHLSHQTAHPPYMNTTIPVKWAEYITGRQDWDPDTVRKFLMSWCAFSSDIVLIEVMG
ncbi:hypothetical protein CPB86DRAFT_452032 [Serendipita vermifera]|nr:hypothetical protein CPB86DRAFT_452032 [Serendipita vermifera]